MSNLFGIYLGICLLWSIWDHTEDIKDTYKETGKIRIPFLSIITFIPLYVVLIPIMIYSSIRDFLFGEK